MTTPQRNQSRRLQVFLAYSVQDKPKVEEVYQRLQAEGMDPWYDNEKIMPGQNRETEIHKATLNSDAVIVFLSQRSVSKEGRVHKSISDALEVAASKPTGVSFLFPVRLDDCKVPDQLVELQCADLFDERGWQRLLDSLKKQAESVDETPIAPDRPPRAAETNKDESSGAVIGCVGLVVFAILAVIVFLAVRSCQTSSLTDAPTSILQPTHPVGWFDNDVAQDTDSRSTTVIPSPLSSWFDCNGPNTTDAPSQAIGSVSLGRIPPDEFIRYYYRIVDEGKCSLGWSLQTDYFHVNKSRTSYDSWVSGLASIDVSEVAVLEWSENRALVYARLTYYLNDGRVEVDRWPQYELTFDNDRNTWLINSKY